MSMVSPAHLQQRQDSDDQLEISADFMMHGRRQLAKAKVKNTFIDVADSEDEDIDARPPMAARKTCPGSTIGTNSEDSYLDEKSASSEAVCFEEPPRTARVVHEALDEDRMESKHLGPCLLLQQGRQIFKVKNTFIDGVESEDEDDEDLPPMVPTKSCPLRAKCQMWPPTPLQASLAATEEPVQLTASPVIAPLEQRQPELSKGGQLHGSGQCKPCAWFWRPQGCVNSQECMHCHLCTAAELKFRKKAKRAAQKHCAPGSESPESRAEFQPEQNFVQLPAMIQMPVIPGPA